MLIDLDIDECALGLDQCPRHSRCLNIPGTYLCQCLEGYKSSLFHAGPVTGQWEIGECRDVDECSGWGGGHQCPVGTHCVNEDGTYRCVCNDEGQCNDSKHIFFIFIIKIIFLLRHCSGFI